MNKNYSEALRDAVHFARLTSKSGFVIFWPTAGYFQAIMQSQVFGNLPGHIVAIIDEKGNVTEGEFFTDALVKGMLVA